MKDNPTKSVLQWGVGLGSLALFGLIMLILFGNLSSNVGFTTNSQGYNDTNNYINNYTESVLNTGKQFGTVGTILGVALLLVILIAILVYAIAKMTGVSEGKAGAGASFG